MTSHGLLHPLSLPMPLLLGSSNMTVFQIYLCRVPYSDCRNETLNRHDGNANKARHIDIFQSYRSIFASASTASTLPFERFFLAIDYQNALHVPFWQTIAIICASYTALTSLIGIFIHCILFASYVWPF